nr:hypothetical protein [Tanacetum cinerariifolium]
MAASKGANQITSCVIDDLIEFSGETSVDGYISFFKSQQIAESHGFINRQREEANTTTNLVRQLNGLIAEMEALEDHGELFDTLMDCRDDREAARMKLQGLNELITQAEQEIKTKEAQIQAMNGQKYGSILNILHGRNELLEKIIGYLVDSGGVLELDPKIKNKEIKPNEGPPHGIMWLKGMVNKDGQFPDDKIRSLGDKLKETEDNIKEETLKVDHDTDAMTVLLGKEKGGYARGVGSEVTYERKRTRNPEFIQQDVKNKGMVTKLINQLAAQRKQLQSMPTKLTPSDVSPVDINPIDNSADEEGETPLSVVGCENDASIQKSNGLATSKKEMEK